MNFYQNNIYAYVNGYEGAKAFQVIPNQNVLLIDSENPLIYMKTANAIGQASIQCFKIESVSDADLTSRSVSNDDITEILKRLDALEEKRNESIV